MIDERKIKILQSIVNDYILTGEPIGSRTIAKKYDLGISSATIRNEMADLEDMGYLEQPHTSSGRIPSSKGYRLYVDKLMEEEKLTLEEELMIKNYLLDVAFYEIDKMAKQVSSLLSELTKLTCIIKMPTVKRSSIKSLQLVKVDEFNLLFVVITDNGAIKNSLMKVKRVPIREDLFKINNILNYRLTDLTVEQINLEVINKIKDDLNGYEDIFNAIIPMLYDTLNSKEASQVFMEGTTNIFNYPEYNNIDKAKEILALLYNKDYILKLVNSDNNMTIRIGDENFLPEAKECSVISAVYSIGEKPLGTIGLIGPRRINYSKVVSVMAEVMKQLNKSLKD